MDHSNVDTLVYQLEDENIHIRHETLVKLRKIAQVSTSFFPVRNVRRFLHCLRRRLTLNSKEETKENAFEALGLVMDLIPILKEEDLEIILSTMDREHAIYYLIESVKAAHKRGAYTIGESEVISKSIRVLSKE